MAVVLGRPASLDLMDLRLPKMFLFLLASEPDFGDTTYLKAWRNFLKMDLAFDELISVLNPWDSESDSAR